jgi:16S rRNA (guanine527-N7)-methyltransferase
MAGRDKAARDEFEAALEAHAARYGVQLSAPGRRALGDYFELVRAWSPRLHLVAPCSPAEFATRHALESLLLVAHLSFAARVLDVGSGAGLPLIPCLILRPDLRATLIEASAKKAVFLREALRRLERHETARVVAARFETIRAPEAEYVTCRALERFAGMLPRLIAWSPAAATLLLFGGPSLRARLDEAALQPHVIRVPESARRFLFVINRSIVNGQSPDASQRAGG